MCHWSASWFTRNTVAVIPPAVRVPARSAKHGVWPRIAFLPVNTTVVQVGVAVLEEADQVTPVLVHGVDVDEVAADLRVERIRHPRRAVHGRLDPVRERLPAALPGRGAASGSGRARRCGDERGERQRGDACHDPDLHADRVPRFYAVLDLG